MNRNRLLLIGIVALAMAGVVSFAVYRVLQSTLAAGKGMETVVTVTASRDLSVGARLSAQDLRVVEAPGRDLPAGVFHRPQDLVGRGVIMPISRHELILERKLAPEKGGSGLQSLIRPGMRAVAVKVNDVISVAGYTVPGTKVDVLLTGNPVRTSDPGKVTTTTVLENVEVLSAQQELQSDGRPKPDVRVVTLLVTPEDAQKLALASTEGRIQLSLRNPLDLEALQPLAVQNAALYRMPRPPARRATRKPVPPPASSVYVVEMIRGDKRAEAKF